MSANDDAIIGVESCGCITYANARPDNLDREATKALERIVRDGGQIFRTTVGGARRRKNFLPSKCPHKPKGWGK